MIASIYFLFDPRNPKAIRYVGWAKNPIKRLQVHLREAKRCSTYKECWIFSLLEENITPILSIIESAENFREREIYWIAKLRIEGHRLTNGTDGGDGTNGLKISDKHRAAAAENCRIRNTPEFLERLSEEMKNRHKDPNYVEALMAGVHKHWEDPQQHIKISERSKKFHIDNPKFSSDIMTRLNQDEEFRQSNIERLRGRIRPESERQAQSKRIQILNASDDFLRNSPEQRAKAREHILNIHKTILHTPEARKAASDRMYKLNARKGFREKLAESTRTPERRAISAENARKLNERRKQS